MANEELGIMENTIDIVIPRLNKRLQLLIHKAQKLLEIKKVENITLNDKDFDEMISSCCNEYAQKIAKQENYFYYNGLKFSRLNKKLI